jgi:hypothetical protein
VGQFSSVATQMIPCRVHQGLLKAVRHFGRLRSARPELPQETAWRSC